MLTVIPLVLLLLPPVDGVLPLPFVDDTGDDPIVCWDGADVASFGPTEPLVADVDVGDTDAVVPGFTVLARLIDGDGATVAAVGVADDADDGDVIWAEFIRAARAPGPIDNERSSGAAADTAEAVARVLPS